MFEDPNPDAVAALAEVAEMLCELVDSLRVGQDADLPIQRIVGRAGQCVPRAQAASLVVVDERGPSTVAATSDVGERVGRIRAEVGQGPSMEVVHNSKDVVVCDDLPLDERWPDFGQRVAAETGIRSIAAFRVYLGRGPRAALSFYSDWPYAFDELAISTGSIFASYCSLALMTSGFLRGASSR